MMQSNILGHNVASFESSNKQKNQRLLVIWQVKTEPPFHVSTAGVTNSERPPGQLEGEEREFFYFFIMLSNQASDTLCSGELEELTKPRTQRNLVSPPAHITQLFKCNSCFRPGLAG